MKRALLMLMLGLIFTALTAQTPLLYDDFTGLNIANLSGQSSWTKGGSGPDCTVANTTAMTYTGYNGGTGEYVQMGAPNGTASRVYKGFTAITPGTNTFYYSFILRLSATTSTGDYFISLGDQTTGTAYFGRLFAKTSGSGFVLGIAKFTTIASATFGTTVLNYNQNYLVVARYTFATGTSNDLMYLWVNPSLSSEPATGSAYATIASGAGGNDSSSSTVGNFHWHNRSLNNPTGSFDGVRVSYGSDSATAWSNLNAAVASTPTITVAPSTLSGFSYTYLTGPSSDQSFTISGSNLTDNISIAAPANYEMSLTSGSGYTTPIVLTQSGGVVANTTVYVRLKSGLNIGTYNGETITASSTGAANQTVTCNGSVLSPPPPMAPVANAATAVAQDGFTARWGGVTGATSYKVDVFDSVTYASDLFFSEYIEGASNNKAIEIFNGTGAPVDLSNYTVYLYANGATTATSTFALSGTLANNDVYVIANAGANTTILALADVTNAVANFNGDDALALYNELTSANVDIFGCIGEDLGTSWGTTPLITLDKTLVRKSNISAGNSTGAAGFPTLDTEWDSYPTDTTTYLGSHTFNGVSYLTGYQDVTASDTAFRVEGLDPSTDYYYVVRAVGTYGTSSNSNMISVSTTAIIPGTSANSSINGAEITVNVPPLAGFIDNSVDIDTASGYFANDFYVTVTGDQNSLVYSITTYDDAALNGLYLINHEGFTSVPTSVTLNAGTLVSWSSSLTSTFIEVSGFASKGNLQVTIQSDETLPVELSSFTAIQNAQNYVNLMWTTQSESGVSGYYIYRSTQVDASTASLVSPLIPASNTSTTQSYVYTDSALTEDGIYYYWLQNVDLDGSVAYHGPVVVNYSANGGNNGTPVIPTVTELKRVYPNPFNPSAFISYGIATPAEVSISIYNNRGQLIRTLRDCPSSIGNHRIEWNGKADNGSDCSSGVYIFKMNAGKQSFVQKAILVK